MKTNVFTQNDMLAIVGLTILATECSDINSFCQTTSVTVEAQAVLDGWDAPEGSQNPTNPSDHKLWHLWEAGQRAKVVMTRSLT